MPDYRPGLDAQIAFVQASLRWSEPRVSTPQERYELRVLKALLETLQSLRDGLLRLKGDDQ